ncbi:MAG: hypothetical protein ACI8Y7_000438 [Candidatus Woesearchaeota archaeon]|jgi:hypothetical protein
MNDSTETKPPQMFPFSLDRLVIKAGFARSDEAGARPTVTGATPYAYFWQTGDIVDFIVSTGDQPADMLYLRVDHPPDGGFALGKAQILARGRDAIKLLNNHVYRSTEMGRGYRG